MTVRPSEEEPTPWDRDDRPERRLLVVAYYFPPLGGVGVQRTLKFVRNLRRSGWRSVVVAPADPAYPIRDAALADEIPRDVEVVRTRSPEPGQLVAALGRRLGRPDTAPEGTPRIERPREHPVERVRPPRRPPGLRGRVLRAGAGAWTRLWGAVLFPDEHALWVPFATRAGRAISARQSVDAIYSSSPPMTVHVIARSLRAATGRPWIADFRDPWVGNSFAAPVSGPRRRMQVWLERRIVEAADRVIVASPTMAADFRSRYPSRADRVVCIPNGYDRGELRDLEPVTREPGTFTIVYSGSVYGARELELFLDGLERLLLRRPALRDRLRVEFVGRLNVANQRIAEAHATADRLGGVVTYTGFLPRREALARMLSADALLQIIADDPGKGAVIGGKVPEYLAFDRPILAVVPRGDARAILEELGWGIVADPEPEAVASGIERLLTMPPSDGPTDPEGRYDREAQARCLAALLDELTDR